MTIPEVQEALCELADRHELPILKVLAFELYRRKPVRRAPVEHHSNKSLFRNIRRYALDHPRASYQEIAEYYDTNIGRVSEALVGKRT